MAVEFTRKKRKTHLQLLIYIFIMLCGSSVWLKMMLVGGSSSGLPQGQPMWMRTFEGKAVVEGLKLEVDMDRCEFRESNPGGTLAEQHRCGLSNAMVTVTATIEEINDNMDGLYLAVLASKDFTTWWQANAVLLPREMFVFAESPLTPQQNRSLSEVFLVALNQQALSTAAETEALTAAGYVLMPTLVSPLRSFFSGAGAIELDAGKCSRSNAAASRSPPPRSQPPRSPPPASVPPASAAPASAPRLLRLSARRLPQRRAFHV